MHQGAGRDCEPRGPATCRARVGGRHPARSRLGPREAHTGQNGEGDIRVIIRHIVEGGDSIEQQRTLQIEAVPMPVGTDDDAEGEP
jgi:hypothetical protein